MLKVFGGFVQLIVNTISVPSLCDAQKAELFDNNNNKLLFFAKNSAAKKFNSRGFAHPTQIANEFRDWCFWILP